MLTLEQTRYVKDVLEAFKGSTEFTISKSDDPVEKEILTEVLQSTEKLLEDIKPIL